jgi:inorganic triphosphatase YgiF
MGAARGRDLETELKFEVDAAGARALGEHLQLPSLGQPRKLLSVYYDTPETDLRDHGLTLRVRDDGVRRVQTVKQSALGGNGFHRGEWECPLPPGAGGDLAPDLDAAARTPLGDVLSRRELAFLRPVFEVEVKRITRSVEIDGAIIEIALDRGCARAEGRRSPIGEVELELKIGSPRALFTLARECASIARLELCFISKAARGYALLEAAPPAAAMSADPTLHPDDTSAEAFQAIAGAALAQIAANARVLAATRGPDALHQLRVGARRLRSAFSIFGPMLADVDFAGVEGELKWLAGELDEARDLDVFGADVFQPALERDPDMAGLAAFGERLEAARARAYGRALGALKAPRFRALMLTTLAWIEAGDWRLGEDPMLGALRTRPVGALAAEEFERRRRKIVKKGRDLAAMTPHARHKLRIKVKRLRYACGFFGGLYSGKNAKRRKAFAGAARDLQDRLGGLTDIAFSRDLAAKIAALDDGGDPKAAFAAGALAGRAAAPMTERLEAAAKAHEALRKAAAFW